MLACYCDGYLLPQSNYSDVPSSAALLRTISSKRGKVASFARKLTLCVSEKGRGKRVLHTLGVYGCFSKHFTLLLSVRYRE